MHKFLIKYFCFCFAFFVFFSSGYVDSQDGLQYLAVSRRMYYDHTFEMPIASFDTDDNIHMSTIIGKDGKIYSITGLGYSLALLPAVVLEHLLSIVAKTAPIAAFPLQHDWPVLLFASMSNAFFGALLTIGMYKFLRELEFDHKKSVYLSFLLILTSNLFIYTKHTFAHMLFTSFLLWTFYLIKKHSLTRKKTYLLFAGLAYGVVVISYNQTFIFAAPALVLYYFLLNKKQPALQEFLLSVKKGFYVVLGIIPFFLVYVVFDKLRLAATGLETISASAAAQITQFPPAYVIFEGIWGLLLSPGKSIFLFSPVLLILVLFWHRLEKKWTPEIISFGVLFLTYLWFISTLLGGTDYLVWHGDSSWGPRYMVATLPFLLLLVALIFKEMTKSERKIVFYPLVVLGMWVNLMGSSLPYQIRFAGLQTDTFFNGRNFTVYEYGNLIPRYSPVFLQSKKFIRRLIELPNLYSHGDYNVRLIDGFEYPFNTGWMNWREVLPRATILFDVPNGTNIDQLSLQIKNFQIDKSSSYSAELRFAINDVEIMPVPRAVIAIEEEANLMLDVSDIDLEKTDNRLNILANFTSTSSAQLEERQVLFLQLLRVNAEQQNIETLDYPYVSPISKRLSNIDYSYWGKIQSNPWAIWHMHSGIYEKVFDFWWLRPLHYWDLPKKIFGLLFVIDVSTIIYFGIKVFRRTK
ncbi:MAG: hypothetical protein A2632_00835 [Candidatus Pacebacteria bacterium RIFCSPHIGHO2_01_FULL_46_16]|nr:MAG: hypothetical protein A2632_00835 [Candidatus Pacebacteria bacterium RIFCSPHIGHO2_01_FULL_46_16]